MRASKERLVIVGASGHGIAALDTIQRERRYEVIGWLETYKPAGQIVAGLPILGRPDQVAELAPAHRFRTVFFGIGDNVTRCAVWKQMQALAPDLQLATAIHPASTVSPSAVVGPGTLVMAGAIVNCGCRIGENCIVNTKASLDHDSEMHPYASILPGVTTGGNVRIGAFSVVCLGTLVSHRVSIGEHTVVGAGSLVLHDLPDHVLAYGAPAKVIRPRTAGEKHF